jgi:hypothetical protein
MTRPHPGLEGELRAIAFASEDGTSWGAALCDGHRWLLASGPDGAATGPLTVTEAPDGGWRLADEGGALSLTALADDPPTPEAADDGDDPAVPEVPFVPGEGPELCRVTGTLAGLGVDWRGIRVRMAPRPGKDVPGSARLVAGWFADGSAIGLIAARPSKHDRPDQDVASATLFDRERWLPVAEPRLSTTYDGSQIPARVNLELWIGEGEHEYPRRAAGEAVGAPAAAAGGAALQVTPLRCHSRGEEGVGVYVLATF